MWVQRTWAEHVATSFGVQRNIRCKLFRKYGEIMCEPIADEAELASRSYHENPPTMGCQGESCPACDRARKFVHPVTGFADVITMHLRSASKKTSRDKRTRVKLNGEK